MAMLFPYPQLVADVGGTNARFAIAGEPGAPLPPTLRLDTTGHEDFAETALRAMEAGAWPRPKSFLLAVAGPVRDRKATLTNAQAGGRSVMIDGPSLAARLGLEQGIMLNDFEALALTLPLLETSDVARIADAALLPAAPMLVVGPGTGLGVAAVLRHGDVWLPLASEGGHVGIGPYTPLERAYWPHLGEGPFSAEDLLSGRGLSRLYRAIAASQGSELLDDSPAQVTERGLARQDEASPVTLRSFIMLLARFAGDMALAFGARGGVFIGGGIAPRLSELIVTGAFRSAFAGSGHGSNYLADIPISLITRHDAALKGLAGLGANPLRFGLNDAGRLWVG
jgi:glucokinase